MIRTKNKTIIEWSLGIKPSLYPYDLNFCYNKYDIIVIETDKYLKGDFFTKVHSIYTKNIKSGHKFCLKDDNYLNKILDLGLCVNDCDLRRVIDIVEKKDGILLNEINNEAVKLNEKLHEVHETISEITKKTKEKYIQFILNKSKDEMNSANSFLDEKEYLKFKFIEYCIDFINKKNNKNKKNLSKIIVNDHNLSVINDEVLKLLKEFLISKLYKFKIKSINKKTYNPFLSDDDVNSDCELNDIDEVTDMIENDLFNQSNNTGVNEKIDNFDYNQCTDYEIIIFIKRSELNKILNKNWRKLKFNLKLNNYAQNADKVNMEKNVTKDFSNVFKKNIFKFITKEEIYNNYYLHKEKNVREHKKSIANIQKKISKLYIYNNINFIKKLNLTNDKKNILSFFVWL